MTPALKLLHPSVKPKADRVQKDFKPPKHVDSQQSTTNTFTFTGSFLLGTANLIPLSSLTYYYKIK